jgi:hypothetical protein
MHWDALRTKTASRSVLVARRTTLVAIARCARSRSCDELELLIVMVKELPTASGWRNRNIIRRRIAEIVPILYENAPAGLDG